MAQDLQEEVFFLGPQEERFLVVAFATALLAFEVQEDRTSPGLLVQVLLLGDLVLPLAVTAPCPKPGHRGCMNIMFMMN